MSTIEFWSGFKIDLTSEELSSLAIPVKGNLYKNPSRCLEIYSNPSKKSLINNINIKDLNFSSLLELFLPKSPTSEIPISHDIYQPPFLWEDTSPLSLAVNFTYNTNAIFRILSNLSKEGSIPEKDIDRLLDTSCQLISTIYKANNSYVLKYINNNINMYLLSKSVEFVVGKHIYNSDFQELVLTHKTLRETLNNLDSYINLSVKQQMALAMGRGIAFLENTLSMDKKAKIDGHVDNKTWEYVENEFAIDQRETLLSLIENSKSSFSVCVILDDTSESVLDLLWMQALIVKYNHLNIHLLLNTAQISINFSSSMLQDVLKSQFFKHLAAKIDAQVFIHETYCPLISYQGNFLSENAWKVIKYCNAIFIKGLNFFETCQIMEKDTFYSFVVYGPISNLYTGLNNYDGVFAYIPSGKTGYIHHRNHTKINKLVDIINIKGDKLHAS